MHIADTFPDRREFIKFALGGSYTDFPIIWHFDYSAIFSIIDRPINLASLNPGVVGMRKLRDRISIQMIFRGKSEFELPSGFREKRVRIICADSLPRSLYATLEISVRDEMLMKTTRRHEKASESDFVVSIREKSRVKRSERGTITVARATRECC